IESDYVRPAKQFLTQSFEKYPTATTIATVFAVTSFVPVVSAINSAGLSLLVVLSATLVFSAAATILVSNIPRFGGLPEQTRDGAATEPAENLTSFGRRRSPMRRAFTAFRNRFSKKGLNRRALVFGSTRTPHPLKWVLLRLISPFLEFVAAPFKIVRLVLGVVLELGVESVLIAGVLFLFASSHGREARKATLAAVVGFLRETLESLEKMRDTPTAEPSASTETPATEAAEDKTVPSQRGVSTTDGVSSEVKARNVAGAAHADSIAATGSN
ncbi:hypothetical protein B0H14DRAFT_3028962, partial [Mycena olivaceomarginata]